jgi:hypothetical protein
MAGSGFFWSTVTAPIDRTAINRFFGTRNGVANTLREFAGVHSLESSCLLLTPINRRRCCSMIMIAIIAVVDSQQRERGRKIRRNR